jgi:hypothetical protein
MKTALTLYLIALIVIVLGAGALWESFKDYEFRKRCVYAQGTPVLKLSAPQAYLCLAPGATTLRVQ